MKQRNLRRRRARKYLLWLDDRYRRCGTKVVYPPGATYQAVGIHPTAADKRALRRARKFTALPCPCGSH